MNPTYARGSLSSDSPSVSTTSSSYGIKIIPAVTHELSTQLYGFLSELKKDYLQPTDPSTESIHSSIGPPSNTTIVFIVSNMRMKGKRTTRNAIADEAIGFLGSVASVARTRSQSTETPPVEESNLVSRLLSY